MLGLITFINFSSMSLILNFGHGSISLSTITSMAPEMKILEGNELWQISGIRAILKVRRLIKRWEQKALSEEVSPVNTHQLAHQKHCWN